MVTFCLHWGQNLSTRDISMCDRHFWCRQLFSKFSKTSEMPKSVGGAGRFFKIWLEQRKPQPKVSPFARQTSNRSRPVRKRATEEAEWVDIMILVFLLDFIRCLAPAAPTCSHFNSTGHSRRLSRPLLPVARQNSHSMEVKLRLPKMSQRESPSTTNGVI